MSGIDFIVPPRTWAEIAQQADNVREAFQLTNTPFLPIIDILELLPDVLSDFEFLITPDDVMPGVMGHTAMDGSSIALPESVYRRACNNSGRDRFTAAHELGHLVLHKSTQGAAFQRADSRLEKPPPYMLSEPQANQFAATVLMPKKFIQAEYTAEDLVEIFGVSHEAAQNRLEAVSRRGI